MSFVIPDFAPAVPEIFLLTLACVILIADLFVTDRGRYPIYIASVLTLLATAALAIHAAPAASVTTFEGMFVLDGLAVLLKVAILLASAVVLVYSRQYLEQRDLHKGEFYALLLFSVLGMHVIVSGAHFLTLYLGLELMSLSLYAMVALNRDSEVAAESAMKYFVLGAIASGMLLYGMSILYGVTGSLHLTEVAAVLSEPATARLPVVLALTFVIASLAFKLGAVPFHMWLPDVYHGAPTPVTLFVGSASKIAAFAMVMRLLVEGLGGLYGDWGDLLIVLSVLSLVLGSLLAIAQSNIKRMLAYSAITHVGFLLLGILAGSPQGYAAATFYTLIYVLMALAGFGMILMLSRQGFEADRLDDFRGLNERSPWFAAMMLLTMFSMAGVPPTVGFYAKLVVLDAVVDAGHLWLAFVAVIFALVSAYYYLRVVKLMYFDPPRDTEPLRAPVEMRALLSANGVALLLLGGLPGTLLELCRSVFA